MEPKKGILSIEISERTVQKWRAIQTAAILPLILAVAFLFKFKGSTAGVIVFFLILIVGIILPQIYLDLTRSHLQLQKEIEEVRKQLPSSGPGKG
jgi:hypothetical protein